MGQIVRFEWLKMKRKRYIWNLLCILIVINSYHIFQISQSGKTMMEGHEKIERQVEGKITDEKISFVTAHYKKYLKMVQEGTFSKEGNQKGTYTGYIMGDYNEFEVYYNTLKDLYEYQERARKICEQAKDNAYFYAKRNNTYEMERNLKIYHSFHGRKITDYYEREDTQNYLEYDFSTLLMVIMVLISISGIWIYEKEHDMLVLMNCSEMPMTIIIIGKFLCMLLMGLLFTVVFAVDDYICHSIFSSIKALNQPLYSIEDYFFTGFRGSILQYMLYSVWLKYIAVEFIAMCIFVLSYFFRDGMKVVCIGTGLYGGMIAICLYTRWIVNPVALLSNSNYMRKLATVALSGHSYDYLLMVVCVLCLLVLGGLIWILLCRRRKSVW